MRRLVRARLLICAGLGLSLCVFGGRVMLAQGGQAELPDLPRPIN